jgi:hypothetical protein
MIIKNLVEWFVCLECEYNMMTLDEFTDGEVTIEDLKHMRTL